MTNREIFQGQAMGIGPSLETASPGHLGEHQRTALLVFSRDRGRH